MRKVSQASHNTPISLSYRQAMHSYFIHDNLVHSVTNAPSDIFKAVIEQAMDTKRLSVLCGAIQEAQSILNSEDLDLFARWWLLCYVATQHTAHPMKLYGSRGEAEHALKVAY